MMEQRVISTGVATQLRLRQPGTVRKCSAVATLLAVAFSYHLPANAADWTSSPTIEVGARYNDNARLNLAGNEIDIFGGILDAGLQVRSRTELSEILFNPRARISRYGGNEQEDSDNFYFDMSANTRTQRSRWAIDAYFSQEQVLSAEIDTPALEEQDFDDISDTATAEIRSRRKRDRLKIRPRFEFDFTQKMSLELRVKYLDVGYDDQQFSRAIDYNDLEVAPSLVYRLSEGSRLLFGAYASRFETDTGMNESSTLGFRLRYDKSITQRSRVFFELGAEESDIDLMSGQTSTTITQSGFVGRVGISRTWERTQLLASVDRIVTPSGSGSLVKNYQLRAHLIHTFKPQWNFELVTTYQQIETLEVNNSFNDRDFFQGRAKIVRRLSKKWSVVSEYTFTLLDEIGQASSADSNALTLKVIFNPPVRR